MTTNTPVLIQEHVDLAEEIAILGKRIYKHTESVERAIDRASAATNSRLDSEAIQRVHTAGARRCLHLIKAAFEEFEVEHQKCADMAADLGCKRVTSDLMTRDTSR